MSPLTIRPSEELTAQHRATGVWRDSGPVGDLQRWRDETPDTIAIRSYHADGDPVAISYRKLAGRVERFAGALYELGVRPGDVVAVQLPSWWQAGALFLAARRLGAVVAPIMTTFRPARAGTHAPPAWARVSA